MAQIRRSGALKLNQSSAGVTLFNSTAAVRGSVFEYLVPRGVGVAFKGTLLLRMKLLDSVGVEMPATCQCRFTYKTPEDSIWAQPIGAPFIYEPYGTLSLSKQEDERHYDAVRVQLGCQYIAFIEDETLCLEVYDAAGTVDKTYTEIYIEHVQVTPEELKRFVDARRALFGK